MFGQSSTWGQQNNQQQGQQQQQGRLFGGGTAGGGFGQQPNTAGFGQTTGGFGQPAQQNTSGGLFGSSTNPNTFGGGGGFGASNAQQQSNTFGAARPAFGATGTSTFGGNNTSGGLFGGGNTATTSTFGNNASTSTGGLFGSRPAAATGGFGAGATSTLFGARPASSSPFGSNTAQPQNAVQPYSAGPFPPPPSTGTANPQFQSTWQQDPPSAPGVTSTAPPHLFHVISVMEPYRGATFEELRLLDYQGGRKDAGSSAGVGAGGFGQPASTGFGQTQQPATTGFGQNAGTSTFGAPKPAGGLFGSTNTGNTGFGATNTGFGQTPSTNTTTGGLFGASQPNQSSPFGTQNNTTSGGLFGQSQQNQPATGGLFGSTSTTFGTNNQQQQQQLQQPPSTSFTFGANKPAFGATGSNGFGASNTGTNTFGQPANTGTSTFGGFGQNQQQQQQQPQPAATGGLFGGGGDFGATNTQNTGSSLFAQNNQQQQNQPAAGGLFGNTAAKPGGLFGSTTTGTNTTGTFGGFGQINSTQPATGGLFGGANTNTAGTGSSLFGQPQQPPATGGLFGNSGGSSLFGAKPAGGTTGSLFGSTQPAQQPAQGGTSSLFGNTGQTGGLFGSSTNTLGGQNQQQNQAKSAGSLFGGGGLFGSQQQQQTQQNQGTTGGMFGNLGQSQPASASLFGSQPQQPAQQPALGGSLFGSGFGQSTNTQPQLAQPSLTTSIDQNPYGRNDLFNYTGQKLDLGSSAKKPALPPLTSSTFRATPSKSQLHKLRGFASPLSSSQSPARAVSPLNVLASPGPSTFANSPSATDRYKGLTDTALSPNAFVPRPSIKKLTVTPKSGQINGEDRLESVLGKSALKSSNGTPASVPERAAPVSPATLLFNPPAANGIPSRPADEFHSPLRLPQRLDSPLRASGSERPPKKGDYWCKPKLEKLKQLSSAELRSMRNFTAGRKGYGEVTFLDPVDLTDLDLPAFLGNVVVFTDMELAVYPDDYKDKPPQGKGLNVPARISLENCFPKDKATKQPITDINDPRHAKFLKRVKNIPSTDFVSYTDDGTWTFTVEHFSKYGIADSDEESEEEMHSPEDVLLEVDEESLREVTSDEDFLPPTKGLHDDEDEDQEGDDSVEEEDEEMDDEGSSMTETEASSYEGDQTIHAPPELAWDAPAKMKIGEEGMRKLREMQSSFFSVPKRAPARFGMTDKADEKQAVMKVKRMLQSDVADFVLAGGDDVMLDGRAVKRTSFGQKFDSPRSLRQPRKYARIALETSSVKDNQGARADAGVALGRSFRCSWGPNGELVHIGRICSPSVQFSSDPGANVFIQEVELRADESQIETARANRLLDLHLLRTNVQNIDGTPFAILDPSTRFANFASLFDAGDRSHEANIWRLGVALFDEIDLQLPAGANNDLTRRISEIRRKLALGKWLENAVAPSVDHDLLSASSTPDKIFTLLSGNQLERAVQAAIDGNDMRLATLASQIGGPEPFRAEMMRQLEAWQAYKANPLIAVGYRRVYAMLAGIMDVSPGDKSRGSDGCPDVPISAGLDWKRAFGLRLWYGNPFDNTITNVLETYNTSLSTPHAPAKPLPDYLEKPTTQHTQWTMGTKPTDVLYGLIRLYSDVTISLEDVLRARNCSPSPLDARLQWHLYLLLARALQKRDFADREEGYSALADGITSAYAAQLEKGGEWTKAAFVLLHLETDDGRTTAIKALLGRHPSSTEDEKRFLIDKLLIPETWLHEVKAAQLASENDAFGEFQELIRAGLVDRAHRVLVDKLAVEAAIRHDLSLLKRLCGMFKGREPEGWDYGGKLFLDYIDVTDGISRLLGAVLGAGANPDPIEAGQLVELSQTLQRVIQLLPALFSDRDDVQQIAALGDLLSDLTTIASQVHLAGYIPRPHPPPVLVNSDRLHLLQEAAFNSFETNLKALPTAA